MLINPDWVQTFQGGAYGVESVAGQSFCRLVDATHKRPNEPYWYLGEYWFSANLFWQVLDETDRYRSLLREMGAVSVNWNSLALFTTLRIPKADPLEFAVGFTADQTRYSITSSEHNPSDRLGGGLKQYCINRSTLITRACVTWIDQPMPLWVGQSGYA